MTRARIISIVEGDGEVDAVPVLIRRYASLHARRGPIEVLRPIRSPASKLKRPGELERTVALAARKLGGAGGILVLLDSEDDCPAVLGPSLLARVRQARADIPSTVILAHREFEAWFLGSATSLASIRGLRPDLLAHPAPESVRGCKEWLTHQMGGGRSYSPVEDQPSLANAFDLQRARAACPSFDKFHREVLKLLDQITGEGSVRDAGEGSEPAGDGPGDSPGEE